MSDPAFGATIAKRKLARRLKELREANGYTANQVCDKLDWGRGKVGRFESNGWTRPDMSDVRDLLRLYEKSDQEGRDLERLAVLARDRPWWRGYPDVFQNEFAGYENDAEHIRVYVPLTVPGLLQTRAHVEAFLDPTDKGAEWRAHAVESRLSRQQILDREQNAPQLAAVITEASLMYEWGRRAERREQILHLVDMSQQPNIELRVLRFQDGPAVGGMGPINIFDFPGDEPSIVFAETEFDLYEVGSAPDIDKYVASFEYIYRHAAEPSATTAHLRKFAKSLE